MRGFAAQFSASPWALRATQKRPCLPGRTSGTVPEARRQRHCARGSAGGGILYARPFIRGGAPPTLAAGQPQAARGSRGRSPRALLWFLSWASKKGTRCRSTTDRPSVPRAEYPKQPSVDYRQPPPLAERQIQDRCRSTTDKSLRPLGGKSQTTAGAGPGKPHRSLSGKSKPTPGRDPAAPPLSERQIQGRRRSTTDKLHRSMSGKP